MMRTTPSIITDLRSSTQVGPTHSTQERDTAEQTGPLQTPNGSCVSSPCTLHSQQVNGNWIDMAQWMKIQERVGEVLAAAMEAPPPTTRKAAYRLQKFVLVDNGPNDRDTDSIPADSRPYAVCSDSSWYETDRTTEGQTDRHAAKQADSAILFVLSFSPSLCPPRSCCSVATHQSNVVPLRLRHMLFLPTATIYMTNPVRPHRSSVLSSTVGFPDPSHTFVCTLLHVRRTLSRDAHDLVPLAGLYYYYAVCAT
jgi:hypothetical protein